MTETLIKNFKDISKTDTLIAGGKGTSLGEMTQAGFLVPSGFVLTVEFFKPWLQNVEKSVVWKKSLEAPAFY